MSFIDLKSKRQSKNSKSYVSALSGSSTSVPTQSSPQSTIGNESDDAVLLDIAGLYPQLPSSLEIRKRARSGRGLLARVPFRPGSVILAIEPHVFVLSNQYLDSYCSSCAHATSASRLLRCSGCVTLRYCNSSCQKTDWSLHKHECSALQRWAKEAPSATLGIPNDAVRCLGRILWRMKSKGLDTVWSKEIQAMQYHKTSLEHSAPVEAQTHLAHSLIRYLGLMAPSDLAEYGIRSAGDLVSTISRLITNTFALTSPSLTPIGATVSPLVALTNHSCLPNAVVVFPRGDQTKAKEPIMNVIALRKIEAGEEVLMAYIDTTLPKIQRQKMLAETYNFTCQCLLCNQSAAANDPRETISCPKSCGGTCPMPTEDSPTSHCSACKAVMTDPDAVIDAIRIGQEALDKATRLQLSDHDKAQQLTSHMIPILVSAGLSPSCHPLLALLKLHQSLLIASIADGGISQEVLDDSIRTTAKYVAGVSALLDQGHPVRGVALTELGKLLAVDEPSPSPSSSPQAFPPSGPTRLKLAVETLLKARNELLVGFGRENEGGEVSREVRKSIVALEKELGVWTKGVRGVLKDTMGTARGKTLG